MTLYKWSQTASADATADSTINWAEGQAPSSVNDSARAMMAATAKYRDDIAGAIVTTGTSTAYAISSYQDFDTPAHLNGQVIAFTPHVTNGATVTLNVDALGPKPIRTAPSAELAPGVIIQGTPYTALYNNTDGAFYLQGVFGNPYSIPIAGGLDYWASTAPNSAFAFPTGQAISRSTYASLFSLIGTQYGTGDGSNTFNLPNKQGRLSAMIESSSTLLSPTFFNGNSTQLGAAGGADHHTLTLNEIPTGINANGANSISVTSGSRFIVSDLSGSIFDFPSTAGSGLRAPDSSASAAVLTSTGNNSIVVTSNNTGGQSHTIVPPIICCNYIMRII
jgi:microcystin-dependent protein